MKKRILRLKKIFKTAWTNFCRHRTFSFATVILISLIIFTFNVVLSINTLTRHTLDFLGQKIDLNLELREEIDPILTQSLIHDLEKISETKEVRLVTKEKALSFVNQSLIPGYADFLKRHQLKNPFPPSLNITLFHPEGYSKVKKYLQSSPYREFLASSDPLENDTGEVLEQKTTIAESAASELSKFSQRVSQILILVIGIFVITSIIIVINAIHLSIRNRKEEIAIMRLVGAREDFILAPFLIEGIFYGFFSVILGFLLFYLLISLVGEDVFRLLFSFKELFFQVVISTFIGIAASYIAIQKYLKGKIIPS